MSVKSQDQETFLVSGSPGSCPALSQIHWWVGGLVIVWDKCSSDLFDARPRLTSGPAATISNYPAAASFVAQQGSPVQRWRRGANVTKWRELQRRVCLVMFWSAGDPRSTVLEPSIKVPALDPPHSHFSSWLERVSVGSGGFLEKWHKWKKNAEDGGEVLFGICSPSCNSADCAGGDRVSCC